MLPYISAFLNVKKETFKLPSIKIAADMPLLNLKRNLLVSL
ncbi:hypothetical protein MUS1_11510 [Marinomonas ushuaiensis DSM 15871]|uniref:Uncharacterized protein n=1 Tax=Marinomonas ushuaiensis DSM 15871 TaxID=1122207 RepID=X7E7L1_9GAMM|nr:hypothetical protein MUS1_11510 [Marinomonas ushuaiensis DSM 15871]